MVLLGWLCANAVSGNTPRAPGSAVFTMTPRADWSRLTSWLAAQPAEVVTIAWASLDQLVGGLPPSATKHHPQWWHGDRPNTRAWRAAGFELERVELGRSVTLRRTASLTPVKPVPAQAASDSTSGELTGIDPRTCMIVLQCSAGKARGGSPPTGTTTSEWTRALLDARKRVLSDANVQQERLLPAWQRYTGTFYRTARPALYAAVSAGTNIVILSGGYGAVTATEHIGDYEMVLRLRDWPSGVLEQSLLDHARRTTPFAVVAFVSGSTDYARLIRRVAWQELAVPAYLVTPVIEGGGAMVKVPRALGQAFSAFWRSDLAALPNINVEQLT